MIVLVIVFSCVQIHSYRVTPAYFKLPCVFTFTAVVVTGSERQGTTIQSTNKLLKIYLDELNRVRTSNVEPPKIDTMSRQKQIIASTWRFPTAVLKCAHYA